MKLLLDEMLQRSISEQLRARGHDVVAVTERTELRSMADDDLFASAKNEQRAIVTYNRDDFLQIARRYAADQYEHHGIVIVGPHRFPEGRSTGKLVTSLERLIERGVPYQSFVEWLE